MSQPNVEDIYPLTTTQAGLLFHSVSEPEGGLYWTQYSVEIEGKLDATLFRQAWSETVARHPSLRTVFVWEKRDEPLQVVRKQVQFSWSIHDWSDVDAAEQAERFNDFLKSDRETPCDLRKGPLLRFALARLAPNKHRFVWCNHHAIIDGWSLYLALNEALDRYDSLTRGTVASTGRPPGFRSYVDWLAKQSWAEAERYFRLQLAGVTAPTPLPFDRVDEPLDSGTERATFSVEATARLIAFARAKRVTVNTVMQAVWGLLLHRYSGEADVLFGVVSSGRSAPVPGVESIIGLFINTLPMRYHLDPARPVAAWLREVHELQADLMQHQHTPLTLVHGWSGVPRGQSLFDSIFVFENYPVQPGWDQRASGLSLSNARSVERSNFPLMVMAGVGTLVELVLQYDPRKFRIETIRRMIGHYRQLLDGMMADAETPIGRLALLTQSEREKTLVEWNMTEAEYPREACLHELIEEQARLAAEAIALVFGEQTMTYGELDRRAAELACLLRSQGVGPDVLVGLCLERGFEMVVGILGILKAGGAYVPIDPAYPADRIAFVLEDSQAPVLVTQRSLAPSLPHSSAVRVYLDEPLPEVPANARSSTAEAGPGNLAYVIYTSGSTGKPKGVEIEHRAVVNFLNSMRREPGLTSEDVLLAVTTLSFDIAGLELHLPLTTGARIVIAPWEVAADGEALLRKIERHGVTVLQATPATWRLMLAVDWKGTAGLKALCGGEAMPTDLAEQLLPRCGEVWNMYGPTETTIWSTCSRVTDAKEIHIGRPIDNTEVYILDAHLQPQPIGLPGELLIGGDGLARGYHKRPELMADRFINHPFKADQRLYRTGDLARWRADGSIDCLGRLDFQVKIRGFRIELGEIEAQLGGHAGVKQAVVVAREDTPGEKRLVAYVIGAGATAPDAVELREHLRGRLPDYMIPAAFMVLELFPLTPNGKIDRKALPAPEGGAVTGPREAVAPRTEKERRMAGIFEKVLGRAVSSVQESFFDLGGHSLLAAKLMVMIEREFGSRVPLARIFDAPTIEQLAEALNPAVAKAPVMDRITPVARDTALPLSFTQERLWFLDQLEGSSPTYNLAEAWQLQGVLDTDAFGWAVGQVCMRHEAFRTTFTAPDSEQSPTQIIHAATQVVLQQTDLSDLEPDERQGEVLRRARQLGREPFNLVKGPLGRMSLFRLGVDDHVFVFVTHHIVYDGLSSRVLRRELETLYAVRAAGRSASQPPLEVDFADFAVWQRTQLSGERLAAGLDFWREYLKDAPPVLELPTDFSRPAMQNYHGQRVRLKEPATLVRKLRELGRKEHATLFHVLWSAWTIVLSRYSGQKDLIVGTPVGNRDLPELDPMIGFLTNSIAIRTRLREGMRVNELVREAQQNVLLAINHQETPFEQVVQALNPQRSTSYPPIFQAFLAFEAGLGTTNHFDKLSLRHLAIQPDVAKFDLTLWLYDGEEGLSATLEYCTALFSQGRVERMLGHFGRVLEEMSARPEGLVDELDMLEGREREQLIRGWNATAREYRREACLHELIEEQARLAAEAIALVFGEQTMTYGELDRRAGELACLLRSQGVGPDVLVGLCLERGFEMVVGILGILKAGGAYVPIDPAYPADRIAFVLEDSQAPVLITQRSLAPLLPHSSAVRVYLDEPLPEVPANARSSTAEAGPGNLAYVIYTSGSTGKPKGVEIEHRAVVNFLNSMRREPGLTSEDVLLAVTTLSFDIAGLELHLPLTTGARIVIAPWEVAADGEALLRTIERHGVTVLQATPATWRLMLAADWKGTAGLKALCGGEAMPTDLAEQLLPRCGEVWNMYGPTETTIWSTCSRVTDAKEIHIGRPIDNTEVYILDAHQQPLPVGLPGELLIGGDGLARGYHKRPELTADRFINHPFKAGQRLYRTGDLARWRADGSIDCLGRLDFQVKIRGFRIELGEIEAQMGTHAGVKQAVVVAREDTLGEKRLVAYVIAAGATAPDAVELREHLRGRLPDYMIPAAFMVLELFPLTPNGKIDRKALPAPEGGAVTGPREAVAPRTEKERRMAGIFEKVLGRAVSSVHESFFDLGGHSLLAAKLMVMIEREFGSRVPLARLFDAPTVEKLAAILDHHTDAQARWDSLVPIKVHEGRANLFLVHGAGGNVLLYRELAHALAPEVSVYGFQSQGLDRKSAPLTCVEDMAARYVRELRVFQSCGPYYIGGYCMGGTVAYEMARLLELEGQDVGLVALLDAYNFQLVKQVSSGRGYLKFMRQKVGFHLDNLKQLKVKELIGYLREKSRLVQEAAKGKVVSRLMNLKNLSRGFVEEVGVEAFIQKINHEAGWSFEPMPYDGSVTVFRPQKNYDFFPDPNMGWSEVVGPGLEVVQLPVNPHAMLINPFATQLAGELKRRIVANHDAPAFVENGHPRTSE